MEKPLSPEDAVYWAIRGQKFGAESLLKHSLFVIKNNYHLLEKNVELQSFWKEFPGLHSKVTLSVQLGGRGD